MKIKLIPIIIILILSFGCKKIIWSKRDGCLKVTIKNILWEKLLFWATKHYDSMRSVYIDGDITFHFDFEDWYLNDEQLINKYKSDEKTP